MLGTQRSYNYSLGNTDPISNFCIPNPSNDKDKYKLFLNGHRMVKKLLFKTQTD